MFLRKKVEQRTLKAHRRKQKDAVMKIAYLKTENKKALCVHSTKKKKSSESTENMLFQDF